MNGRNQRRNRRPRSRRRRFTPRKRVCAFCVEGRKKLDYKEIDILQRFVTDRGKIRSRRKTGTCAKHQRMLAHAIKRARNMALLPYVAEHIYGNRG